ncbi:MAG: hypothetical protein M0030_18515 [Actinomycetota bacterium]|nr:hypothetical protein [Actinomycetota bacterium]
MSSAASLDTTAREVNVLVSACRGGPLTAGSTVSMTDRQPAGPMCSAAVRRGYQATCASTRSSEPAPLAGMTAAASLAR